MITQAAFMPELSWPAKRAPRTHYRYRYVNDFVVIVLDRDTHSDDGTDIIAMVHHILQRIVVSPIRSFSLVDNLSENHV